MSDAKQTDFEMMRLWAKRAKWMALRAEGFRCHDGYLDCAMVTEDELFEIVDTEITLDAERA